MRVVHRVSDAASATLPTLPQGALVLLPLGSTEQHGPHLPTGTDTVIAAAVADAVASRLGDPDRRQVLVAPPLGYGASGEHQDFPGTISLGNEALELALTELIRSLSTWVARVVVVNGHGGNVTALARAVPRMRAETHDVAWVPCAPADALDAHAGHTETSLMLHLRPELVDMARARAGNVTPIGTLLPALVDGGVAAVSSSGVLGDPTAACPSEGQRMFDAMVGDVSARVAGGWVDERGCARRADARSCRR